MAVTKDFTYTVGNTCSAATALPMLNDATIKLFPNPASTTLFLDGLSRDAIITIFDLNGKIIIVKPVTNKQLDISTLTNGIYTLKIVDKSGMAIKKFVKQ
jgi:hypothetical protein